MKLFSKVERQKAKREKKFLRQLNSESKPKKTSSPESSDPKNRLLLCPCSLAQRGYSSAYGFFTTGLRQEYEEERLAKQDQKLVAEYESVTEEHKRLSNVL